MNVILAVFSNPFPQNSPAAVE